jgi:hypothetical protein
MTQRAPPNATTNSRKNGFMADGPESALVTGVVSFVIIVIDPALLFGVGLAALNKRL